MQVNQDTLRSKTMNYLKGLLSGMINLPIERIEADAPMEAYGIDSVLIMRMTSTLEKSFGRLPKTLFFEYQTIEALTGYFAGTHGETLSKVLGLQEKERAVTKPEGSFSTGRTHAITPRRTANHRRPRNLSAPRAVPKKVEKQIKDIAIIGVAGRYPGAEDTKTFWENLCQGRDCITEIPKERWDHSKYFHKERNTQGKTYTKWGGFIDEMDAFDPQFFNISPKEAGTMDPQERLFLECVYETLEDGGYTRQSLAGCERDGLPGNVGVYVGVMYEEYQLYSGWQRNGDYMPILGGSPSSIANRVSYYFNLHGPCMAVDTMCSSSLTSIHLAYQSLQQGECDMAIAGGVNVSIHPNKYLLLGQNNFASSKGRCESFGKDGDGYVPGEGVGAVLLKPLDKAIEDGDNIYGVMKASAINHGGKTNGFTVPNPTAQAGVIQKALRQADLNPRAISYIEAHGTGTSLGDPIEMTGLTKTYGEYTKDKQFCAIGSVKSNIGHCEGAAGIAAVTKVLLQMKHQQLVPSIHASTLNPHIDFENTPFVVQQSLSEWQRPTISLSNGIREYPRTAGISSFGAGGSNAHMIIQEYVENHTMDKVEARKPSMIMLSAKNEEGLQQKVVELLRSIDEQKLGDNDLANVAYTLQVGREAMDERLGLLVGSMDELVEELRAYRDGTGHGQTIYRGNVKKNRDALAVLMADDEIEELISKWVQREKHGKILELWAKGLQVNWNQVCQRDGARRISLPTYPFKKKRYWLPKKGMERGTSITSDSVPSPSIDAVLPRLNLEQEVRVQPTKEESSKVELTIPKQEAKVTPTTPKVDREEGSVRLQPLVELQGLGSIREEPTGQGITLTPTVSLEDTMNQTQPVRVDIQIDTQQAIQGRELLEELSTSLADTLYMDKDEVDIDEKFVDIGLDSITGVEWIQGLNKKYGVAITATKVYDYPTLREFAGYLGKELGTTDTPVKPQVQETPKTPRTLDEVIQQLQSGALDVEEADALLKQLNLTIEEHVEERVVPEQTPTIDLIAASNMPTVGLSPVEIQPVAGNNAHGQEALQEELAISLAQTLYMEEDEVDIDEKFVDMGLDSITGVEWIQGLNGKYNLAITATKVYDYPTIREFAQFLSREIH